MIHFSTDQMQIRSNDANDCGGVSYIYIFRFFFVLFEANKCQKAALVIHFFLNQSDANQIKRKNDWRSIIIYICFLVRWALIVR